jgi:cytochrome c-type biogenesis protein CcmF
MLGRTFIIILFFVSLINSFLFLKSKNYNYKLPRILYLGLTTGILIVSIYFLENIFAHNYQFTYIWEYSSSELPSYLLISSFFAGNQGSFLLWTLLSSIIGLCLLFYIRKHQEYESTAMGLFILFISFLLLILIFKSPFEYVWETFKSNGLKPGFRPAYGKGLNPVLQNFWIIIHPPILFTGYVTITIPFVLALGGLIRKDYLNWVNIAYPWVLLSAAILGIGILLGGFWAYETLGWGGFWAWDPVENSSLIPWLTIVALAHTMIVQRKTKGLVKTNFLLAIISFLLVLYATFLTRSGVLGNTSIHSFTSPGNSVFSLLVVIQLIFGIAGITLFIIRTKDLSKFKYNYDYLSKEFLLSLGSVFIIVAGVIIFIGTNWPLILDFTGQTKAAVDISYYNKWNLVIASLILLSNGFSLYLNFKKSDFAAYKIRFYIVLIFSAVTTLVIVLINVMEINLMLLMFSALYSLFVNLQYFYFNIKKTPSKIGGNLSHIGFALLILGIISTSGYSQSTVLNLKKGTPQKVYGYTISLIDKIQIEKNLADRQRFVYRLKLQKGSEISYIEPVVYWSDFNDNKSPIIEPAIKRNITFDLHALLKSVEMLNELETVEVIRDSTVRFLTDSNNTVTLVGFDMKHSKMSFDNMPVLGAILRYNISGKEIMDTVTTRMDNSSVYTDYNWNNVAGTNTDISFTRLIPVKGNIAKSIAVFAFKKSDVKFTEPEEILTVEIAYKPFINFVWYGSLIMFAGFIFAMTKIRKNSSI